MSETNIQLFPGVFRSVQGGANPDFFLHSAGRVGIGNQAPATPPAWDANTTFKLNVTGHTHINGNLDVSGSVYGDGSNLTGTALPWQQSMPNLATDIKYEGGNVGIGGVASTNRLKVYGTVEATSFSGIQVSDVPDLDANKITGGTLDAARIPDLSANKITTDTLDAARIPDLSANKITTDTLDAARIPDLSANKITTDTLDTARIPDLDAGKITGGTLDTARIPDLGTEKISGLGFLATVDSYPTVTQENFQWRKGGTGHTSHASYSTKGDWYIRSNDGSGKVIIQDTGGNTGVGRSDPGYKLDVSGTIRATGNVIAYSDRRLKSDIVKIGDALNKVDKLNGYTYTMNDERSTGLIAQEVLEVLPEAVKGSEKTTYALAYGNMAGILVEAIKELRVELNKAHARIDELESKIA